MNRFIFFVSALLICSTGSGQYIITESDFAGTWEARVSSSRAKSMDMLFDGSTITILADGTYSGNVTQEISGNWRKEDDILILDSDDLPFPLQLSEWSKDSCIWRLDKVNSSIPFYRITREQEEDAPKEQIAKIHVENEDITGDWIQTNAEGISKSREQNIFLFGDSEMNENVVFDSYGRFSMSRSSIRLMNDAVKGSWIIKDGMMMLAFDSGKLEQLRITKCTPDSLVLEDIEERLLPMVGSAKIRFTYTKELAAGLKKYLIMPEVPDTFQAKGIAVSFMAPKDFEEFYYIDNMIVSTFGIYRCSWCTSVETKINSIKDDLTGSEKLVRFLESPREGMILFEGRNHLDDSLYYEFSYVFSYEEEVYVIKVICLLRENINTLSKSIADMKIISP